MHADSGPTLEQDRFGLNHFGSQFRYRPSVHAELSKLVSARFTFSMDAHARFFLSNPGLADSFDGQSGPDQQGRGQGNPYACADRR